MMAFAETLLRLRSAFVSGKTRTLEFRTGQLDALINLLEQNEEKLLRVLYKDLRKCKFEAVIAEIRFARNEVIYALNNIASWVEPELVERNFVTMMDQCFIRSEPFGVVLIIGTWSYPIQLLLTPLVGAISAGNCVVLKPSEVSTNTSELLATLIPKYLDKDYVAVFSGGPVETMNLLVYKFDNIFYTGSSTIGKTVMKAAAEHLTPVTLELGGKNPCYVDLSFNLESTAHRLAWGRFFNAGQTCVAPDYVLCTPEVQRLLVPAIEQAVHTFYGKDPKDSPDFGRIINDQHFQRLQQLLKSGRVAVGGQSEEQDRYIAPTVLVEVTESDAVMQEEVFGPILPVLNVGSLEEAIEFINRRRKPLALYVYSTNNQVVKEMLENTSSGGFCSNDNVVQMALNTLPFGGVDVNAERIRQIPATVSSVLGKSESKQERMKEEEWKKQGILASFVEQSPSVLSMGAGDQTTLRCTLTNTAYPFMFWYKQQPNRALEALFTSAGEGDAQKYTTESFKAERSSTTLFTLELSAASPSHTAVYYCACSRAQRLRTRRPSYKNLPWMNVTSVHTMRHQLAALDCISVQVFCHHVIES
uniref:aldehyde dehydrogenase family 3 member B1 isoform X2 n=1 Tax=Pristiophorus japonicus TaxID=55135 RepID=UPI00398EA967